MTTPSRLVSALSAAALVAVIGLAAAGIHDPAIRWPGGGLDALHIRAAATVASGAEEGGAAPDTPDDWLIAQRALPGATIPRGAFAEAAARSAELGRLTARLDPALAEARWSLVGPANIGGRVVDVAVDPFQVNTVYAAAATGGVWKSTDAGATLQPAWPAGLTQSMGALAIAHDATLYAGTGETNPGGGSITFGGTGVYRSYDRGATWQHLGLEDSGTIGRIAVHPTDRNRVYVAASGDLFNPGGQRGLYRTKDGGEAWELVLPGGNDTTGAVDVAVDPKDPRRVYAAMWDHRREPDLRRYGGPGSGVYRSTDGGDTWAKLTSGLPASTNELGRIGIAVAPSSPGTLYATVIKTSGSFQGFYASTNGGDTWSQRGGSALSSSQATYGWWFGRVWVDPLVADHVFVAGVPLMESPNGGATWASQPTTLLGIPVHVDQHAMAWHPKVPNRVYLGNDGGLYRSESGGVGGSWVESVVQPFTQFYGLDVSDQDPARVVGGTQDNGSLRSWQVGSADVPSAANTALGWDEYYGGDGEKTLINPQDQRVVYACYQYGNCARSDDGGDTTGGISGGTSSSRRNWFTPMEFDPNDPSIVYYGGNVLDRSTDAGESWTRISPDLTGGKGRDTQYPFGTLTTIAPAKSDGKTIYVGTDDGRISATRDLGGTWTRLRDADGDPVLPERWVTRVAVEPTDADVAFVTFSGFRSGSDAAHVFRTADGGIQWEDISGDLPNAPVNDVVIRGGTLYIATDVGVFLTRDLGTWLRVGDGLPLAPVTDIRLHSATDTLFASTFGRGVFKVSLPAN